MDVYFFNVNKRHNSTGQPSTTGRTPASCKLKDGCSITKPVIELSLTIANQTATRSNNYAYIPDFNRYYFITDWILTGTLAVAYLQVDALASFRTAIFGQMPYILRSSVDYNGNIRDTKYPLVSTTPTYNGSVMNNPLQPAANNFGVFVVGVVGKGATFGSVSYYAMSQLVFIQFTTKLFNLTTQWGDGGTDLADGLKKAITDPMQYVVSCIWLPYSTADFVNRSLASAVTGITVGYDTIDLGVTAYMFNNMLNIEFTNLITCNVPTHPYAQSRGIYMNREPFSRYYASFYPFAGLIELDSSLLGSTIDFVYTVDLRTGKGILSICPSHTGTTWADWKPTRPYRVIEAQIGVDIPVATIQTAKPESVGEYVTNTIIAAGSEFGSPSNFLKKAYSSLVQGVGNLIGSSDEEMQQYYNEIGETPLNMGDVGKVASAGASMKSTLEMFGSQSTISFNNRMPFMFWGVFYYPTTAAPELHGRPLMDVRQLSTQENGFVICETPHLQILGAFSTELNAIENALATGVYLE